MSHAVRQTSSPVIPLEDEQAVIARIRDGDRAAFSVLYRWYSAALYRIILSRQPDRTAAEDVLKDTFRIAMERLDRFVYTDRSIYFWLRRIALNLAIDQHRHYDREQRAMDRAAHEPTSHHAVSTPDRALDVEETARDVDTSLSRLNARYASALRMRLIEGRSREECALALDVTTAHFDVILHRAAKAFRKVYPP